MRRNNFFKATGKHLFFLMTVSIFALSSCYNDDDLKSSISGLEDRVAKIEASLKSVQTDITTIQALTDALAKNKSISSVIDNENGSYTIKFSDNTEVIIRNGKNGDDAPQITVMKDEADAIYYWGITKTDGTKTYLTDGDGNKMPVTAAAPKVRINADTKEWEISTDGGSTWESTGVIAAGETGSASLFEEVNQDADYVYFTLKDGTVLKVLKSTDLRCTILSGKLFFTAGEAKLIEVDMSGIDKFTVTKPDGWKASLTGKGLSITAPVAENAYAETEGKVAVVAVANNGQSLISEITVTIGTAPIETTIENRTISTTLAEGVSMYYIGIMPTDEYSSENVANLLNESSRLYIKTTALNQVPVAELLGKDPELGVGYMVWTMTQPAGSNFMAEEVMASPIKPVPTVLLNVTDITFEGATISAVRKGCDKFYSGILEKSNFSPAGVIEDLSYGGGTLQTADYNGPMVGQKFDYFPKLVPGTVYVVWSTPYNAEEDYSVEDLKYMEVNIPALTYDGTATVTIDNITTTISSVSARFNPGTDCYKFYYSYMNESTISMNPTEKQQIDYLLRYGSTSQEAKDYERANLNASTKGYLRAVALNAQGQLGSLVKAEVTTKDIIKSDITVAVAVQESSIDATFTLTPTAQPLKYRYIHMTTTDFNGYPFRGQEDAVEEALTTNKYDNKNVVEINASDLVDNKLVLDGLLFTTEYVLFVIAVDADGNSGAVFTKVTYTTAEPTYIRETVDPDTWNANAPTITIDKIEAAGNFSWIYYTVTPNETCKEFYSFVGDDKLLIGMYDEQIKYVMKNGAKSQIAYEGKKMSRLPTQINVTWMDKENRVYSVYKYVVSAAEPTPAE